MERYLVKQRSGRRWVVVGTLIPHRTDRISLREELRTWLWKQGIQNPNMRRYCLAKDQSREKTCG